MINIFTQFSHLNKMVKIRLFHSFMLRIMSNSIFPFLGLYLLTKFSPFHLAIITFLGASSVILGHQTVSRFKNMPEKTTLMWTFKGLITVLLLLGIVTFFDNKTNISFISVLFIAILMIYYFLAGVLSPLIDSLLYPFLIGKDKKKVSAISYWLNNLSAVVGILVGTFSSINNLSILFIFMAIICCISAILFNKTLTEEGSLRTTSPKGGKIDKQTNKTDRNVLLIICFSIGTCLIFMIESRLNDLLSVYLTHKQIIEPEARKIIGNILLVNYGTVILFSPFIEKLIKSISAKKRLIAGMIIMSFSVVMIFSGELKIIEVYMYVFLYTIGEVFYFPSRQVEIASLIPKENVTAAYALDRTVITGAKLLSTLLILIVAIPYLFCLVILICIFSSIVLLLSQVYSKKRNIRYYYN